MMKRSLPSFVLGIRPLAVIIQLIRTNLLEVLSKDYIRTAYSKGLSRYQVIFKHGLKIRCLGYCEGLINDPNCIGVWFGSPYGTFSAARRHDGGPPPLEVHLFNNASQTLEHKNKVASKHRPIHGFRFCSPHKCFLKAANQH